MKNEKKSGQAFIRILLLLSFLLSIVLLTYSVYLIYTNTPGPPENVNVDIQNELIINTSEKSAIQFQPNMKFNKNNLSYFLDPNCDAIKKQRMKNAFEILSKEVGNIFFYEVNENPIIEIDCSRNEKLNKDEKEDFFIAGEGGGKEIIKTGRYNVIGSGIILLYNYPPEIEECNSPNVELHELLHVFGFDHSANKNSIMYPYLSCKQKLDESIILELRWLYSEPNLPDLYFEEAKALKKGRYLDFNLTVKNSGVIDAKNVSFTVIEDNEIVETKKIGDIKYGAGVTVRIENFKLLKSSQKKIVFKIDYHGLIKEIDKKNNVAEIKFSSNN